MDNISKILDFRNLEDNWNGSGVKKPSDELIIDAIDFVRKFKSVKQPEVFITSSGLIQFEWECQCYYLEYELSEKGIHMLETIYNEELINRYIDNNEYEAINFITKCLLDRWYRDTDID